MTLELAEAVFGVKSVRRDAVLGLQEDVVEPHIPHVVLDHVQEFIASANLKDEDIRMSEKSLSEKGWNGEIYGIDAVEFLKTALDKCRDGLTAGDIGYLEAWDWFE